MFKFTVFVWGRVGFRDLSVLGFGGFVSSFRGWVVGLLRGFHVSGFGVATVLGLFMV